LSISISVSFTKSKYYEQWIEHVWCVIINIITVLQHYWIPAIFSYSMFLLYLIFFFTAIDSAKCSQSTLVIGTKSDFDEKASGRGIDFARNNNYYSPVTVRHYLQTSILSYIRVFAAECNSASIEHYNIVNQAGSPQRPNKKSILSTNT